MIEFFEISTTEFSWISSKTFAFFSNTSINFSVEIFPIVTYINLYGSNF